MPAGIYQFEKRRGMFTKGHFVSEETRHRQSLAHLGKKIPEEQKKKMGKANENHWNWQGGKTKHPHYASFKTKRHKIKKIGNGGSHTLIEWEILKKHCQWTCLGCLKSEPEIKLTEDHIIPVSKGGTDDITNIQPLCRSCNAIKFVNTIELLSPLNAERLLEDMKNK